MSSSHGVKDRHCRPIMETGQGRQETGDKRRRQEMGPQKTGDRRRETGDGIKELG